ncbi:hypothetical protein [Hymenobacter crusticola]|uniref:Uncharacterized protein n=1 Tax=Hymenobacter crusticola TaxID=1770526 RepID=A0A243W5P2_9BACT|nr:hypothetical protein [Hymenobacter crusticola]OUJ68825.1 hypothetical protein BXP70_27395 [Hymenobacter crusticola]
MKLEISTWLASPGDYAAGVALFEKYGTSRVVKRLLAGACTTYTREVLARELSRLLEEVPAALPAAAPAPAAPIASVANADPLARLKETRRGNFARRDYLRAQLERMPTDEERRVVALEILDLADSITASYDAEAHFQQHGVLPAAPAAPAPAPELASLTSLGDIHYHLKLLRTQRSKLQDRPDRAEDHAQVVANIALLESKLSK